MEKVIQCPCGTALRDEDEDELVSKAQRHATERVVNHGQIGFRFIGGCSGDSTNEGVSTGTIVDPATGKQQVAPWTTADVACSYPT